MQDALCQIEITLRVKNQVHYQKNAFNSDKCAYCYINSFVYFLLVLLILKYLEVYLVLLQ